VAVAVEEIREAAVRVGMSRRLCAKVRGLVARGHPRKRTLCHRIILEEARRKRSLLDPVYAERAASRSMKSLFCGSEGDVRTQMRCEIVLAGIEKA
jgi:hypothetical protein